MSKVTQGPWAAIPDSREDGEGDWYVLAPDEEVVTFGLSEPDATLIAAAPDLLAALKALCTEVGKLGWRTSLPPDSPRHPTQLLNTARAAIAKAEGTS